MTHYYYYGMRLRGFSLGCQPMDKLEARMDSNYTKYKNYYDILVYKRPLTDEEIENYSLDFLGKDIEL